MEGLLRAVPQPWPVEIAEAFAMCALNGDQPDEIVGLCLGGLVDQHGEILRRAAPTEPTPLIDRALLKVGDCEAERRCLEANLAEGPKPPERRDYREHWLQDVRCAASAELIEEAVRRLLVAQSTVDEVTAYLGALDRTLGSEAIVAYDRLMADPDVPGSQWLWYSRQRCLDTLAEQHARRRLPNNVSGMIELLDHPGKSR